MVVCEGFFFLSFFSFLLILSFRFSFLPSHGKGHASRIASFLAFEDPSRAQDSNHLIYQQFQLLETWSVTAYSLRDRPSITNIPQSYEKGVYGSTFRRHQSHSTVMSYRWPYRGGSNYSRTIGRPVFTQRTPTSF